MCKYNSTIKLHLVKKRERRQTMGKSEFDTLKEVRVSQNKKQSDVAKAAKISESYYNLIENGNRKPAINIAYLIAKYLGLTLDEFFLLLNFTKCKEIINIINT